MKTRRHCVWLISLLLLVLYSSTNGATPTVTVKCGRLEGLPLGEKGGIFLGIPYALPPIGPLRWKEPQPMPAWDGLRPAKAFGPSAMQPVSLDDSLPWTREYGVQNGQSEDCLYLNVWSPDMKSGEKLPVLVFIHGGAFYVGSGEVPMYDGVNLTKQGIIVVTFNYRLGILGFFAHPELSAESPHKASGNYGLMDQIAALRWVRENIEAFGGDPSKVTIWGQSAGALSVSALLLSSEAKGLFQHAVASSGFDITSNDMKTLQQAEEQGVNVAEKHHATSIEALRAVSATELYKWDGGAPIADGWLLPGSPEQLMTAGHFNDVPVMAGYMANDPLLGERKFDSLEARNAFADERFGDMADNFRKLYPASKKEDIRELELNASRDKDRVGLIVSHDIWTRQGGKSPFYAYYFTRAIPWPQHPQFGAFHSGELPYFFDNLQVMDRPWEKADHKLAKIASGYLVNFIKTGNPNGGTLPLWKPLDSSNPELFHIDVKQDYIPLANEEAKINFWKKVLTSDCAARKTLF